MIGPQQLPRGATEMISFERFVEMAHAVNVLLTCGHPHHFAVLPDGARPALAMSPMAVQCVLREQERREPSVAFEAEGD